MELAAAVLCILIITYAMARLIFSAYFSAKSVYIFNLLEKAKELKTHGK